MTSETFIKGKDGLPVSSEINKGIVLNRNLKRITNLSKNETVYSQGDGVIKIAPFDNYYLFTIYSELDMEDIPVDLHNMGSFFLTFKDKSSEVRIKNYVNTKDINSSSGQILFKISQEQAEKILSLDTNVFYLTSMIYDNISNSDETVLYSGKFVEYNDGNVNSLTEKIAALNQTIENINNTHLQELAEKDEEIKKLSDALTKLRSEYSSIEENLRYYKDEYTKLCDSISDKNNTTIQPARVEQTSSDIEEIDNTLKKYKLIETAKNDIKKYSSSALLSPAISVLQQNIIGIKPTVTKITAENKIEATKITQNDVKLQLANIVTKTGVFIIYAFMYTKYADLYTETEKTEYNNLVNLYNSTASYINENKYNNIEYYIIYSEKDYGKLITKYNINTNSIIVTKNNINVGKVELTDDSTAIDILQKIQTIINNNN